MQNGRRAGHTVWYYNTGETTILEGHTGEIVGMAWMGDDLILSWAKDATLRVWDLKTATSIATETSVFKGAVFAALKRLIPIAW